MAEGAQPGGSLDREVAIQVFGWKVGRRFANGNGDWERPDDKPDFRGEVHRLTWSQTPRWSTDIAKAMDLLCHVRQGRDFIIASEGDRYVCAIEGAGQGEGATISEAICRMALVHRAKSEASE